MNSIVVTSTKQNIKFGYEGEDNVTKIIFPYDESWLEYGEGNFEVRILRCGDEVAYTATEVVDDRQAMTLTMTVTDIELSVRGRGEMQLCYVCPDSIKKSPIYQYTVNRSVDYKYAVDPPEGSIIASVEKSLSEIKNTTNRLSNSVISIESSIDDVNSQINNINDKISEFDEEIDSIGDVETRVGNLETSVQSINGRINTAEGNINENTESISNLNESVTELENRKVTDLETSGGRSDSGKYLTVGTDGKVKATSLVIPTITVDASLSTTSTNPVQNKVIKTELNNINSNIATCNTEISKINGSLEAKVKKIEVASYSVPLVWTTGKYINRSGEEKTTSNTNMAATLDFIPVYANTVLYLRCYAPGSTDACVIYEMDKSTVREYKHLTAEMRIEIEADGYIRLSNESNYIANDACYLEVTNCSQIEKVEFLKKQLSTLSGNCDYNWLDSDKIKANQMLTANTGMIAKTNGFGTTDFIPVVPGGKYLFGRTSSMLSEVVCFYNFEKEFISGNSVTNNNNIIEVPENINIAYMRVSVSDLHTATGMYVKVYSKARREYHITTSEGLLVGMKNAYAQCANVVIVEAGEYDLIDEYEDYYGSDYFNNYTTSYNYSVDGDWGKGIWLKDIEIIFSPGSKVVAEYNGSNATASYYFSAFACGDNVIIDGLQLEGKNLRYGIHPDFWVEGLPLSKLVIRNCILHNIRENDNTQDNNCSIGAGFPLHGDWLIENVYFKSDTENRVLRIHNYNSANAQSRCVVRGCYIEGAGHVEINSYSTSEYITEALVTDCSWETPLVNRIEGTTTIQNVVVYEFNNTLRGSASGNAIPYFPSAYDTYVAKENTVNFKPSTLALDYSYKGQVSPEKRYLAIGFDDFRASDFSMVLPLFDKYGAKCEINRVAYDPEMTDEDKAKINAVIFGGHELGDHTFMHTNYPYSLPLFNGQNPASLEGNQTPYPTNDQMRVDVGNGKNALGKTLTAAANIGTVRTAWGSLTDAECQNIREYYSLIKSSTLCGIFDTLSNKYLGTSGSSAGSWDSTEGKYTGGIFTGCSTSENHEVWERILLVTRMYYKEQYGLNWQMQTWSWPGSMGENISFLNTSDNLRYYDAEYTKLINYQAKFTSSLTGESRSWNDCLRAFGFIGTHDTIYPGRWDGQNTGKYITRQLIINADRSRKDAVLYPTTRTVDCDAISTQYPETFFSGTKSKAAQMYDAGTNKQFYKFIEALRNDTANGIIHGEVIDSIDNYSERMFLEEALRYCKAVGIEVITKAQAYDICFHHRVENGNLIYNPLLRNTAKEYMPDAENIPNKPDGYTGNCSLSTDSDGINFITAGSGGTYYTHFGVPTGKLRFSADVKGTAAIKIKFLKNSDTYPYPSWSSGEDASVYSSDANNFVRKSVEFVVPNNAETNWEQMYEGLADKITAIQIRYSPGLEVKNIRLEKIE